MDEPLPSVRIDIDSVSEIGTVGAPPPAGGPSGRSPLVIAGIALAVLAAIGIVVFSLQPDDGETALGDQRQPTTTTTEATETTTTTTTTTTTLTDSNPSVAGVDQIELNAPVGNFFGLSIIGIDGNSPNRGYWMFAPRDGFPRPILLRSSDGLVWEQVVNDLPVGPTASYGRFIAHDAEMALVRQVFDTETTDRSLERWVSTNGTNWDLDATYAAGAGFNFDFFTAHANEVIAYPSGGLAPGPLNQLLRPALPPEVELPESGVCFVDSFSDTTRLFAFACDGTDRREFEISNDDFIDPDSVPALRRCLRSLQEDALSPSSGEATVVRFEDDSTRTIATNALPLGGTVQDNGTVVALDFGSRSLPACDSFLGPTEQVDPFIELWHSDGSIEPIALPEEAVAETFPNGPAPFPLVDNGELYVSLGNAVWHFDARAATWNQQLTLPELNAFDDFQPVTIMNDRAFAVGESDVLIGDLETGETSTVAFTSSPSLEESPALVHVDASHAFIFNFPNGPLLRVELPQRTNQNR